MERDFYGVVWVHLLNNDMRQGCEREAGKQKHSHAEHRVGIFDRHTCSLLYFGAFRGTEWFCTLQFFHFSFVLNQIVHLPVSSENVSWRGQKVLILSSHP